MKNEPFDAMGMLEARLCSAFFFKYVVVECPYRIIASYSTCAPGVVLNQLRRLLSAAVTSVPLVACSCSAQLQFGKHKEAAGDDASIGGKSSVQPVAFLASLQSQHHDLCPWNGNACPKEFMQLPPRATEDLRTGERAPASAQTSHY